MRVTFYGVRGGYPASGAAFVGVGSHTTCIRVDVAERLIVVDAGTGMARLGRELVGGKRNGSRIDVTLLMTHGHHDHLAGLPHFLPLFRSRTVVRAFGPPAMGTDAALRRMFSPPWFPVRLDELPCRLFARDVGEAEVLVFRPDSQEPVVSREEELDERSARERRRRDGLVVVRVFRCLGHPRDGVYVYRIEHEGRAVVIATDVEAPSGGDVELARFARGADLLVHDAQYTSSHYMKIPAQGFGHSTPEMAAELASAAGVGALLLTHHSPESNDDRVASMVADARRIFANTEAAREGMVVDVAKKPGKRR